MPPHGRRRPLWLVIVTLCALFISSTSAVSSAVIGLDLGTEYIKASIVKAGTPLDIVLSKDSKRKEFAAVAFKGSKEKSDSAKEEGFPERIYGGDAVALSARFPKDVYPNLKALLGLNKDSKVGGQYHARHPELAIVDLPDSSSIGLRSNSFVDSEEPFSIEELLAMEIKNIKANAESMAGKGHSVEDAVITVPPYFSVAERKAVTSAASLAGLRTLSLISDGLAVGLNYATSRTFPVATEGGKPEIHLVYDMGAGSTSATVLKFQGRVVKDVGKFNKTIQEVHVLGTAWDRTLGGDELNDLILEDLVTKFTQQEASKTLGVDPQTVRSHGRTMAKLWKESERIRQVLSANSQTVANFESLYHEDLNFKYKLSRSEFETLAAHHIARVQAPVVEALESAKIAFSDLDSIILHGGASRTPFVQKQLENIVPSDKVRTNVNSDEAAVLGAGFKAATISPSFRVKEIRTSDSAVYPVHASWNIEGKDKQQKLFIPSSLVSGPDKTIQIKASKDFTLSLSQQVSPDHVVPVSSITTLNLTDSVKALASQAGCQPQDITPKFTVRLSSVNGLPEVVSSSISCEATEAEKKGVVDGMKDFLGFGSKKDDQKPIEVEEDQSSSSSITSSSTSTSSESKPSASASGKAAEKATENKKKTITIPIGLSADMPTKIQAESSKLIKNRLASFDASDRARVLRSETLNNLEAYVYKVKDVVEDEGFIAASTQEQRDSLLSKSSEIGSWLYEDGSDAPRNVLKEKLDELRGMVNPINKRKKEANERPEAVKRLKDAINQAETMEGLVKQHLESQSSSEAAASSTSTTSTSATETTAAPSADEFADLEEESSTGTTTTASEIPEIPQPLFSASDLVEMEEARKSVEVWLDEKTTEQDKLAATDDPILLSSDLDAKAKELSDAATNMLMKQIRQPKPKKSKASSKKKKSKSTSSTVAPSESSETASDTATASEASASSETSSPPPEPSPTDDEPSPEPQAETTSATDPGAWSEASDLPEPEPGEGIPSVEEQIKMFQAQQVIDEQLAKEKSSALKNAEKSKTTKKTKKAKPTVKSKPKGKSKDNGKAKSKGKGKEKGKEKAEGHSEL